MTIRIAYTRSALPRSVTTCSLLLLGSLTVCTSQSVAHAVQTPPSRKGPVTPKSTTVRFAYDLKAGETYRYKVIGLFSGHFPPFAQPNSPPIFIKVLLTYAMKVKKQDAKGTEVAFDVEAADLILLEKEPPLDGATKADDETPFPLPLSQVQSSLNVTATLKPDGSVVNVTGGDANSVKINLGIELRKLFLLMLPVTFPERPVGLSETWKFEDGLLGKQPGKTSYSAKLDSVRPEAKNLVLHLTNSASSLIDDRKNKMGQPTTKEVDTVERMTGKATVTGEMNFLSGSATNGLRSGRLKNAVLNLNALVDRKRTVADPDKPEEPLESKIDVKARLIVQSVEPPRKPAVTTKAPRPAGASKLKETKKP